MGQQDKFTADGQPIIILCTKRIAVIERCRCEGVEITRSNIDWRLVPLRSPRSGRPPLPRGRGRLAAGSAAVYREENRSELRRHLEPLRAAAFDKVHQRLSQGNVAKKR